MLSTRQSLLPVARATAMFCVAVLAFGIAGVSSQGRPEAADASFSLTLLPTEGALIELLGAKDRKADRGWHIDRDASGGLDHVDVVEVGEQPKRTAPSSSEADLKKTIDALFKEPRLWGIGVRAKRVGRAHIVLKGSDPALGAKVIEVDVVKEAKTALMQLSMTEGENVLLEVRANPSTGAQWRVNTAGSNGLDHMTVETGRIYDPGDQTDWRRRKVVGAPQLQEWQFRSVSPGNAHVVLDYGPPWQKETLYRQLTLDATIGALR